MAAKILALSSGKIGKNSYLTSKEILPPDQSRLTEQAEFFYSTLGNVFQKQIKAISDQGKKQDEALDVLKSVKHQLKPR